MSKGPVSRRVADNAGLAFLCIVGCTPPAAPVGRAIVATQGDDGSSAGAVENLEARDPEGTTESSGSDVGDATTSSDGGSDATSASGTTSI